MILAAAALGAEVDDAAGKLAPFRANVVVLDFKFADRILNRNDDRQIDVADVQRLSIQVFRALVGEGTAHLIVSPAEWVLADWSAARTALGNSGRGQENQVKYVAAIKRNIVRLALVYDLTERRGVRCQKWSFRRHFDRLTLGADFQRNVNARANLHLNGNIRAPDVLEARLIHFDRVRTRVQVDERILSVASGTAEPEASVTVPVIDPKVDCAASGEAISTAARHKQTPTANTSRNRFLDLIMSLSPPPREARLAHPAHATK